MGPHFFLSTHTLCTFVSVQWIGVCVDTLTCTREGQRLLSGVFSYHSLPYFLSQGFSFTLRVFHYS